MTEDEQVRCRGCGNKQVEYTDGGISYPMPAHHPKCPFRRIAEALEDD